MLSYDSQTNLLLTYLLTKGQIKPKVDWCAIDSPKKQKNELVSFYLDSLEIFET